MKKNSVTTKKAMKFTLEECACDKTGWDNLDGNWGECPLHFVGQLHPETRDLLLDEPGRLAEEDKKSRLKYKIKLCQTSIDKLQLKLRAEQERLHKMELELVNRTITVRGMPAVTFGINEKDLIEEGSKS
jgi:hypothetical protein